MKPTQKKLTVALILLSMPLALSADDSQTNPSYASAWSGSRIWIGPEFWANPLQDWRVEAGEVVGSARPNRTLHCLTHQVAKAAGAFEMQVRIRLDGRFAGPQAAPRALGGFRIGIQGQLDDYRHVLVHATNWVDAGVRGDGKLAIGQKTSLRTLPVHEWISLSLSVESKQDQATIKLTAKPSNGGQSLQVQSTVPAERLLGNVALLSHGFARATSNGRQGIAWRFGDWRMQGTALQAHPQQTFGPILWTQYSLSRSTVKLCALMAPVADVEQPARLQIKRSQDWEEVATAPVDPLSRTATFRLPNWDDSMDTPYRVTYQWEGEEYNWPGTIRRDPKERDTVTVAAFTGDNGYIFPNTRITRNVGIQNPDLLFFSGDQIYESHGGFGITRTPVDIAALDYLRKYWQFGWSWRELLKDRASVILPDDHDVYQGNIWGHNGRRIPELSDTPSGADWPKGGYAMDPDWVNAIQRTQTAHLPDPYDPRPVEQGIEVYFTALEYGGLSFAILEDRKFKSGPAAVFENLAQLRRSGNPMDLDHPDAELLGPRQEEFLESWVSAPRKTSADFMVVLSQTILSKATTHAGSGLRPGGIDLDANGWPQNKRNRALKILSPANAVMVCGDQHSGILAHLGVDEWEDGPVAFMVPGIANGFPRAWWPKKRGEQHQPSEPDWTGRYFDPMGNRMTVLAAANPEKGSNEIPKGSIDPETLGHLKGSGHGILKFNRKTGEVTFEAWRLQFDAANPKPGDQFEGFPKKLKLIRHIFGTE